MKINRKSLKINRQWMKIYTKSMESTENQWKSNRMNENLLASLRQLLAPSRKTLLFDVRRVCAGRSSGTFLFWRFAGQSNRACRI